MSRRRMTMQEVVRNFEDRQRNLLPVDPRRRLFRFNPFGWGNPRKPRGVILVGVLFLVLAAALSVAVWVRGLDAEGTVAAMVGAALLYLSIVIFRSAFRSQ